MSAQIFEAGNTYETRDGSKAHIMSTGDGRIRGTVAGTKYTWYMSGRFIENKITGMDLLMPWGASNEGAGRDIGELTERIDNLEKHCEAMQGHIERLQRHVAGQADVIDRIRKLENGYKVHDDDSASLFHRIVNLERARAWIDTFKMKQFVDEINDRLDRFAIALDGEVTARTEPPKRIFAGGWVNVYYDAAGPHFSRPWDSQEEARKQRDPRERFIACLYITIITEGDGL